MRVHFVSPLVKHSDASRRLQKTSARSVGISRSISTVIHALRPGANFTATAAPVNVDGDADEVPEAAGPVTSELTGLETRDSGRTSVALPLGRVDP